MTSGNSFQHQMFVSDYFHTRFSKACCIFNIDQMSLKDPPIAPDILNHVDAKMISQDILKI